MTAKAYLIHSAKRTISAVEYDDSGIADIRRLLELKERHSFSLGAMLGRDALYVDDAGMRLPQEHFFQLGDKQPLGGNGLLAGADKPDRLGEPDGSEDPRTSLSELQMIVHFLTRHEADLWAVRRAGDAAATINGTVVQTWESAWREMPYPDRFSPVTLHAEMSSGTRIKMVLANVWMAVDYARELVRHSAESGVRLLSLDADSGVTLMTGDELDWVCRTWPGATP